MEYLTNGLGVCLFCDERYGLTESMHNDVIHHQCLCGYVTAWDLTREPPVAAVPEPDEIAFDDWVSSHPTRSRIAIAPTAPQTARY